jgi:hypothetical protein
VEEAGSVSIRGTDSSLASYVQTVAGKHEALYLMRTWQNIILGKAVQHQPLPLLSLTCIRGMLKYKYEISL